ncbi:hypothetical protein DNTS_010859 [Danionella cerebrum]|uniref:Uncharacterized protein n=1 Tax=Danionella cerebrum TaxID=2873325 RepID=A0A553QTK9_9TELE|nr:hypothetical protein DNTS_010859 [Danionella translucida]
MADKYAWWKNLTGWNKNNYKEDQHEFGHSDKTKINEGKKSNLMSNEPFDSSGLQHGFIENTCRRHWTVSRSGRFKEKRRGRVTMPENNFYDKNAVAAK